MGRKDWKLCAFILFFNKCYVSGCRYLVKICILWHNFLVLYLLSWECMPFFPCRRFGTWTVAKLTGNKNKDFVEGPICNGTQVIGWHVNDSNMRFRRFHADMSGFAFNSSIIWDPKQWHRPTPEPIRQLDTVRDGFQVSTLSCHIIHLVNQIAICLYSTKNDQSVYFLAILLH